MNTPDTEALSDTEVVLANGDVRLHVSPYGASLRGLTLGGEPVVTAYEGAHGKVGGQGDVLIPFPGRVRDGCYQFSGQTYQLDRNDKEGPNAIHGFLRTVLWDVDAQTETEATFSANIHPQDHAGYPFGLRAQVTWQATPTGLSCAFRIQNTGDTPAPVAAGFHPYFTAGTELINRSMLQVPFAATLEYDAGMLPTGRELPVADTPYDFRRARRIDGMVFNTCYLHPQRNGEGKTVIVLHNPDTQRTVSVTLGEAISCVVLYSGDPLPPSHSRRALAIEPMTCGSDAFNHPEWGLAVLAPGQSLSGDWQVEATA